MAPKVFPFKWIPITAEEREERAKHYKNPLTSVLDVVISEPGGVVTPKDFQIIAEQIYNMEVRPDDIWIVTYPKCGTTWAQEMIWQIMHNIDIEGGKVPLEERFPFLEFGMFITQANVKQCLDQIPDDMKEGFLKIADGLKLVENMLSPRFIKTHLPMTMLPPDLLDKCKVVFVGRNPKDCCVSYYNHETLIDVQGFTSDLRTFIKMFLEDKIVYGSYWYHLQHSWKYRNHPNAKFIWFEDMKKDLTSIIKEVAEHLGKHLTEMEVLELDNHLYFDNFKKNPAVNDEFLDNKETGQCFMNKGIVGNWKNYFSAQENREFDQWIARKKKEHGIDKKF